MIIWHYAVWKSGTFMWPACMSTNRFFYPGFAPLDDHGQTIVRGEVTCEYCLRMMRPS